MKIIILFIILFALKHGIWEHPKIKDYENELEKLEKEMMLDNNNYRS